MSVLGGDLAAPAPSRSKGSRQPKRRKIKAFQDRVRQVLISAGLVDEDLVVVAVSGGADSTALLDVLVEVRRRGGPSLHVAHFNHGLRPEAAAVMGAVIDRVQDARLLSTVGNSRDFPIDRSSGTSMETAARNARWAFLRSVAQELDAARIVTGHTRDDQAETVVMNMSRGSGLRGFAGMRVDDGEILRPLLDSSRVEVVAYARDRRLTFDDDPMNATHDFRRNRVRHEVMPVLQNIYPGASKAIARSAGVLADQLDMPPVSVRDATGVRMPLHSERLAVVGGPFPEAVVAVVRVVCGSSLQLGTVQLGALAQALRTGANGRWIELNSHLQAFVRDGVIGLYPERVRDVPWQPAVALELPGEALIPGGRVVAEVTSRDQPPTEMRDSCGTLLDADRLLGQDIVVRPPIPHERVFPEDGSDSRDLMHLLRGRGVATAIVASTPVLAVNGRAACTPGIWCDREFAPQRSGNSTLLVRVLWDAIPTPVARA